MKTSESSAREKMRGGSLALAQGAALLNEAAWAETALSLNLSNRELQITRAGV